MEKQEIKPEKCGVLEVKVTKYLRKEYIVNNSSATERLNGLINKEVTDVLNKNSFTLKTHDMRTSPQG